MRLESVGKLVPTTEACCKWQSGVSYYILVQYAEEASRRARETHSGHYTFSALPSTFSSQYANNLAIENSADAYTTQKAISTTQHIAATTTLLYLSRNKLMGM